MPPAVEPEPEGVWYRAEDYAGFIRRVAILAIDASVLALAAVFCYPLTFLDVFQGLPLLAWLIFCLGYLVFLEAYAGTLGFLVTGVKIVTLYGERPSMPRMLFRLLLWALGGPFQLWVDLLWMTGDDRKQTVRDKMAGTYVVRREAIPIGSGQVKLRRLMFMAFNLLYPEVDIHRKG